MTNKMTYSVALTNAIALTEGETRETLERLLAQVQKRNSTENRKPTKAQKQNASLAEIVRGVLVYSMGDAVVKEADKRVNRFRLA